MRAKPYGFTLIELAIVLVIIGLIVGAIVAGQSLIVSSRIQSFVSQVNDYRRQVEIFEDKYASLPGDMINAEDIWPDSDFSTDNGNGNGSIEMSTVHSAGTAEDLLAWEHLNLAGLVPYVLTGGGVDYIVGETIPSTTFEGGGFRVVSAVSDTAWNGVSHVTRIDAGVPAGSLLNNALLTPVVSEDIDVKLDDGFPTSGQVRASDGVDQVNGCDDAATPALYQVNSDAPECVFTFFIENVN